MKKSLFKKSLLGLILAIVLAPISGLAQEREVMDLLPPTNLSGVVTDENDVTLTWGHQATVIHCGCIGMTERIMIAGDLC